MHRILALVAVAVALSGCSKDPPKPDDAAKAEPTADKEKKDKPEPAPIPLAELSKLVQTQEDFEVQVLEEITADQLEAEISKLEEELAADPE